MRLGMVGLGRMGANMTRRLMGGGHELVVTDLSAENVKRIAGEGAIASDSLDDFVGKLGTPRIAWLMVPAGGPPSRPCRRWRSECNRATFSSMVATHTSKMTSAAPLSLEKK